VRPPSPLLDPADDPALDPPLLELPPPPDELLELLPESPAGVAARRRGAP
jgi:hypothetical protein